MRTLFFTSTLLLSAFTAFQDPKPHDGKAEGGEKREKKEKRDDAKKERTRVKAGDEAPEFTVKTLDGKEVTLASLRGEKKDKIVVVNFWSHCCPWSRGWDPELSKIAKDYAAKNVVVVSIDSNRPDHTDGQRTDNPESIRQYHKENSLAFEVYVDPEQKVANAFGGETTPDVFVIGKDGKVAYTGQVNDMASPDGASKVSKNYLRDALDSILAGKPVANATTPPKGCSIKRAKKMDVKN